MQMANAVDPVANVVSAPPMVAPTIPGPNHIPKHGRSRLFDLLTFTALAGCIVAICVRVATLEQRILQLETKAPSSSKPYTAPTPVKEQRFQPIREYEEEEEEDDAYQPMSREEDRKEDASPKRIVEVTDEPQEADEGEDEEEAPSEL